MNQRPIVLLALLFIGITHRALAQGDTAQNLLFVKEGRNIRFDKNDYQPGKNAFYMYRNCIYQFVLKNKQEIDAWVVDVRNDSLYYRVWPKDDKAVIGKYDDTLALHPAQLKKIRMLGDQIFGLYTSYSLQNCRYVFENNARPKTLKNMRDTVYAVDSSYAVEYIRVRLLVADGFNYPGAPVDTTYYVGKSPNRVYKDSAVSPRSILKKGIWFSPTAATTVKGVNLGLQTTSTGMDGMTVQGVNINADALSFFIGCFALLKLGTGNNLINLPDTVRKSAIHHHIGGLSISGGGLVGEEFKVNGVSINGGICMVTQANGLVITGSQNVVEGFNGVMITTIRNLSVKGRGLQIGLFNICKHFKGIQIGLWNVNSKRKLPLINWSF